MYLSTTTLLLKRDFISLSFFRQRQKSVDITSLLRHIETYRGSVDFQFQLWHAQLKSNRTPSKSTNNNDDKHYISGGEYFDLWWGTLHHTHTLSVHFIITHFKCNIFDEEIIAF